MAPRENFVAYSTKQWAGIKNVVRYLALDADVLMLSGLPTEGDSIPSVKLHEKLEWFGRLALSLDDLFKSMPTPQQHVEILAAKLKQTEEYDHSFGDFLLDYGWAPLSGGEDVPFVKSPSFELRRLLNERLHTTLSDVVALLQAELEQFAAAPARSGMNAVKYAQAGHRKTLLDIWREIGGESAPRKLTVDFLWNCGNPVFPVTRKAVEQWLYRHRAEARGGTPKRS